MSSNKKQQLLKAGVTHRARDFQTLCHHCGHRLGIIAEGDSWFAYPRRYLLAGPSANLIDLLAKQIRGSDAANLMIRAANGDEAATMLSGKQKLSMARLLDKNAGQLHLLLFSAGGNDLVGPYDLERVLLPYKDGMQAQDCINQESLDLRLQRLAAAYLELMDLRNHYAPHVKIMAHSYDIAKPSNRRAEFLKVLHAGPWLLPALQLRGIPKQLHFPVAELLFKSLKEQLQTLETHSLARGNYHLINLQGQLRPGHGSDWADEIHPSPGGFKRLFKHWYGEIREQFPQLPA
jgi:hypothetical protein